MAGESARESARRHREKAERLARSAEMHERGALGEEATAEVLAALPAAEWTVQHDLRWPGRKFANVDHVVIGPPGIFVIDTKNWSGRITMREGRLRQNGYSRDASIASVVEAARAVAPLAGMPHELVRPVLCFVLDEELAGMVDGVLICSTANLVEMLQSRARVLSGPEVRDASLALDSQTAAAMAAPNDRAIPTLARPGRRRDSRSGRKPTNQAGERRRIRSSVLRLGAAGLLVAVVIFKPDLITELGETISGLIVGQASD